MFLLLVIFQTVVFLLSLSFQLHVLLLNVLDFDKRWEEVLLILDKYKMDCLILTEVGSFELSLIRHIFTNFRYFYQKSESNWEKVLMLFKSSLAAVRVKCETPNVCVVHVELERVIHLIGVYASKSKTWSWNTLTNYVTGSRFIFGDFNIHIDSKANEMAT